MLSDSALITSIYPGLDDKKGGNDGKNLELKYLD
jgi:hypothetical protein